MLIPKSRRDVNSYQTNRKYAVILLGKKINVFFSVQIPIKDCLRK